MGYIVVGLDGSPSSQGAFREAIREAVWRDCHVVALHVVNFPVVNAYTMGYLEVDDLRAAAAEFLHAEIETLAATYTDGFPVEVEERATVGHYGDQIIEAATQGEHAPADLVVLGSRGMGGFKGLLLGSVTTYAVHHLSTPLLIVPDEDTNS